MFLKRRNLERRQTDRQKGPEYLIKHSRRVGDEVPGVVAVLFSPAEVAGLAVMSLKRLVVYEAT